MCGAVPNRAPLFKKEIDSACGQLSDSEPNLVLISDWYRPCINHYQLVEAVYGQEEMAMNMTESGPVGDWYRSLKASSRTCQPNRHTRLSAVGAIVWTQSSPNSYGRFVHNAYAREEHQIPASLFDPYPQRVYDKVQGKLVTRNM